MASWVLPPVTTEQLKAVPVPRGRKRKDATGVAKVVMEVDPTITTATNLPVPAGADGELAEATSVSPEGKELGQTMIKFVCNLGQRMRAVEGQEGTVYIMRSDHKIAAAGELGYQKYLA